MEFKKCNRCGSFYVSNDNVCCNCLAKERADINKFKTFIGETNIDNLSLNSISIETGISKRNLNRFLESDDFIDIANKINLD